MFLKNKTKFKEFDFRFFKGFKGDLSKRSTCHKNRDISAIVGLFRYYSFTFDSFVIFQPISIYIDISVLQMIHTFTSYFVSEKLEQNGLFSIGALTSQILHIVRYNPIYVFMTDIGLISHLSIVLGQTSLD